MIPKMDYIVVTSDNWDFLPDCLSSIRKQTNVNKIYIVADHNREGGYSPYEEVTKLRKYYSHLFDAFTFIYTGHFMAKTFGSREYAKTDYVVFVDDDVQLKDNWIEEMWPYMRDEVSIVGFVYLNKQHLQRVRGLSYPREANVWESRLQNTIVKRKYLSGFKRVDSIDKPVDRAYGIDAGVYFGKFLAERGKRQLLVPVFSKHVGLHKPRPLREGIRGGSRRRYMGMLNEKSLVKYTMGNFLGGIKNMFKYKSLWHLRHPFLKVAGLIYGFFKWSDCLWKYDYG